MTLLTSSWDTGVNPFSSGTTKSSGEYTGLLLSNSLILSILPWKCKAKDSASSSLLVCVGHSCSTCLVVRLLTSLCSFHESLVHSWILSCRVILFFALSKPKYEFLTFLKATHRESSLYLSHFFSYLCTFLFRAFISWSYHGCLALRLTLHSFSGARASYTLASSPFSEDTRQSNLPLSLLFSSMNSSIHWSSLILFTCQTWILFVTGFSFLILRVEITALWSVRKGPGAASSTFTLSVKSLRIKSNTLPDLCVLNPTCW